VAVDEILAFSSDGSQMLTRPGSDVVVRDRSGRETNVTNFPIGTRADGAAWSEDGTLAVVSATRPSAIAPQLSTSDDLWLYFPNGTSRHFALHVGGAPAGDVGSMIWSPGGTWLIVDLVDMTHPGEPAVTAGLFMSSTLDGTVTSMPATDNADTALPAFSPDGSMLASMTVLNGLPSLHIATFDGAPPLDIEAVTGGPWTQFAWVH